MNKYLRSFIIGSSYPVFILYFLVVRYIVKKNVYKFNDYVIIAPLALGVFNMLSLYISEIYHIDLRKRLLVTSMVLPIVIFMFGYLTKQYSFKKAKEWLWYYVNLCIIYLIVFNIIVYYLESHV